MRTPASRMFAISLVAAGLSITVVFPRASLGSEEIEFSRDVKPILADKCYACHGPDAGQRQGGGEDGLRFDTEAGAFADLDGHFAIVAGNLDASVMIQRIRSSDAEEVMPPPDHPKSLTQAEIATLVAWIEQGSEWSQHWAYSVPDPTQTVRKDAFWIDAFVSEGLRKRDLSASPAADRTTLVRRAFFDVIGLPPSLPEVNEFLHDASPQAWENLIDRLLASPHFGERMAIYWLDLVRYADTVGYHGDQDVSVSPFRDYVINAFNDNMPFDQFTREQLAGDLLPEPNRDQLIASGYNKLGMMSAEGGAQPKEYLTKYASDRVRTASTVWLGSTLGCAECHDHKFDPFTQKDFYQFASFFADIEERGLYSGANSDDNWGPTVEVPDLELDDLLEPIEAQIAEIEAQIAAADVHAGFAQWLAEVAAASSQWETIAVAELKAVDRTELKLLDDHSVLASGPGAGQNIYTVTGSSKLNSITGIRLEVLPDESLPGNGPGRANNGNFVLTEIKLSVHEADGSVRPAKFSRALASIEQADGKQNAYEGWKAAAAIDDDVKGSKWGWAILPEVGKTSELVIELESPMELADGKTLQIDLEQKHDNPGHTLGRFRLSATSGTVQLDPRWSLPAAVVEALEVDPANRSDAQTQQMVAHYRSFAPELAPLREQLDTVKQQAARTRQAHTRQTLITRTVEPRVMRVLRRGNWMDESGEVVQPGVPHFLTPLELPADQARATRLDLANWIVSRDNPLTARVFVNRLWKLFFGMGLSKTLDDIGVQGEFPSHPQLLDALAIEFVDSGWDIKHMIKLMMLSETYQQSSLMRSELSELDPYNRLLARQSRFRLDAEMIRDNVLAVSGLLVRDLGGRSVKPYQPEGLLRHLNFPPRTYKHDSGQNQYRRGVYTHWQRQFLHPAMQAFDAPAREECTAERSRSNTPLAALVLLNDPSYVEAARVFAEQILQSEATSDADRIEKMFLETLNRAPNQDESGVLQSLIASQRDYYKAHPDEARSLISTGEQAVNQDVDPVELAAALAASRAIFNMHEFITRN